MKVTIKRTNLDSQNTFDVPAIIGEWTIMDILDYIALNHDPTIGYYRHSVCNHKICGRCAMRLNGKAIMACSERVEDEEILLEPLNNKIIRDLIIKN